MALPSHYNSGTATVAVGDTAVTGQNSFWLDAVKPGDLFGTHRGIGVRIAAVNSDTSLTLAYPWPHLAQAAAPYEVQIIPDAGRSIEAIRRLLAQLSDGLWLNPDAYGTLAERANYNTAKKGFRFMRIDVTPFQVSVKSADASGAWSGWTSLVGPKGDNGANGISPPGTFYDVAFEAAGRPAAGEEFSALFARSVAFPSALGGSVGRVNVAPTGSAAVFSIRKNDAQFATLTFPVGSKSGVFAGTPTNFVNGDRLSIRAPATRNPALSDLLVTLSGNRI